MLIRGIFVHAPHLKGLEILYDHLICEFLRLVSQSVGETRDICMTRVNTLHLS